MIQIGRNIIVNDDERVEESALSGEGCFLTCGLSLRSTVTASSIREEGFTYCLQRSIFAMDGTEILPQEFQVLWNAKPHEIYPYLEIVTLLLLCGLPKEIFSVLKF